MVMSGIDQQDAHPQGTDLVRRVRWPRVIGVALCAGAILPTLLEGGNRPIYWLLTFYFIAVWPQLAFFHASRARSPLAAERINLWIDSLHAGFWIAAVQLQPMPSAALWMATSLSNVTVGGVRFLLMGWTGHLTGMAIGVVVWGFGFQQHSSLTVQLSTLPLLLAYPWLMGQMMFEQAMKLKRSRRELRYLSEHDALSGVHNRRYFDHALHQAFSQYLRHPRPLTLLICDVDAFKQINDQHGHGVGDEVIRQLGAALTNCARAGDTVARLGGDEFVVLLSDANEEQAALYAARVQEELDTLLRASGTVTACLSFGTSMADRQWLDHEHWLEQADAALYRRKRASTRFRTTADSASSEPALSH